MLSYLYICFSCLNEEVVIECEFEILLSWSHFVYTGEKNKSNISCYKQSWVVLKYCYT